MRKEWEFDLGGDGEGETHMIKPQWMKTKTLKELFLIIL